MASGSVIADKCLQSSGAVHQGRMLQFDGDRAVVAHQQPGRKGHHAGWIGEDQRPACVDHAQVGQDAVERNEHERGRQQVGDQQQRGHGLDAAEVEPGQCIAAQRRQDDRQRRWW